MKSRSRTTAPATRTSRCLGTLLVLAAFSGALASTTASAHDMWIEPTSFGPGTGDIVGARLRVGQDMIGDPLRVDASLIKEFVVDDGAARRPLIGRDGSDPAGLLRVAQPGLLVIGYRSNPSINEQTAEKFAQYLKEEGLEAIAAERARRGQTGGVRESYTRAAKSLLLSGPARATDGDRVLGFTLELVAERNPYLMSPGQELPVRLTHEGKPLAGALVVAMNRLAPTEKLTARSDKDGRVRFTLPRGGMWLIKAVHAMPARPEAKADWESIWASLTFNMPAGTPVAATSTH